VYAGNNTHYIIFEYTSAIRIAWMSMGGHGWTHVMLWVGMGPWVNVDGYGLGKVETPIHDNDLILTPIIAPQSG
jgi:hypothetical protein